MDSSKLLKPGISNLINTLEILELEKPIMNPLATSKTMTMIYWYYFIYVDGLAITKISANKIQQVKFDIWSNFEITDKGLLHYCLGVEFLQSKHAIFLSQVKYAKALFKKFRMTKFNPHLHLWKLA